MIKISCFGNSAKLNHSPFLCSFSRDRAPWPHSPGSLFGGLLLPRIFKIMQFSGNFKGKIPIFEQIVGSAPPLWGQNSAGPTDQNPGSAPGSCMHTDLVCDWFSAGRQRRLEVLLAEVTHGIVADAALRLLSLQLIEHSLVVGHEHRPVHLWAQHFGMNQ